MNSDSDKDLARCDQEIEEAVGRALADEMWMIGLDDWYQERRKIMMEKIGMNGPDDYVRLSARTESSATEVLEKLTPLQVRLLHAQIGMATEVGEISEAIKKRVFYRKPLDRTNLIEEIGDLMWYVALACTTLDLSLESIMVKNVEKLRARYPDRYNDDAALKRDLDAERKVLEA